MEIFRRIREIAKSDH